MRIAVVGTGYVGLVSGACFSEFGVEVSCVDTDATKIARLERGEMPIYEPGLAGLVAANVAAGRLSLPTLVARLSSDPARVLGLPGGRLTAGAPADITILDPAGERTVDPARFLGRSRNTPFGGWRVTGGPWMTIVGGTPVWSAEGGLFG